MSHVFLQLLSYFFAYLQQNVSKALPIATTMASYHYVDFCSITPQMGISKVVQCTKPGHNLSASHQVTQNHSLIYKHGHPAVTAPAHSTGSSLSARRPIPQLPSPWMPEVLNTICLPMVSMWKSPLLISPLDSRPVPHSCGLYLFSHGSPGSV